MMEEDYFVEISLDSVLHKASGLESSLRTCANKARHTDEGCRSILLSYQNVTMTKGGGMKLHPTPDHTPSHTPTTPTDLSDQWERLTAYIVSLEKEVQFYKQLSQDIQTNTMSQDSQGNQLSRDTQGNQLSRDTQDNQLSRDAQGNQLSRDTQANQDNLLSQDIQDNQDTQETNQLSQNVQKRQNIWNSKERITDHTLSQVTGHTPSWMTHWNRTEPLSPGHWPNDKDFHSHALLLVFPYLSREELCQVAMVCRKWCAISRHPSLWRKLILLDTVVGPGDLIAMSQWCVSTQVLVLHGLMPPTASCDQDLQSYITKTRGSLEQGLRAMMKVNGSILTSLTVTECNLMATERTLWLASVHCPNLTSFTYWSDEFPPSSESLWSLANGCRHLQHLSLPPVLDSPNAHWFNDDCLVVIAHAWPHLLSLTVGGSSITSDGLKEVAHKCPMLRYLEIIHGPSLHKEAMMKMCLDGGFKSLSRLILNFTPTSHVALKVLIESCNRLESLEVHVAMACYFSDKKKETVVNYKTILDKIKVHSKGRKILHLYEH